jgi:hypothetical protein
MLLQLSLYSYYVVPTWIAWSQHGPYQVLVLTWSIPGPYLVHLWSLRPPSLVLRGPHMVPMCPLCEPTWSIWSIQGPYPVLDPT